MHIHGLVAFYKEDMENSEFSEMIFALKKFSVMDLCPLYKVEDLIKKGLVEDLDDWYQVHIYARDFLVIFVHSGVK